MHKATLRDSYQILHIIFAGVILMVFIYSGLFSPSNGGHPIPSQYKLMEGKATASTGMSRAFSSIVRLDFSQAEDYNAHSLEVSGFFFVQFWLRVLFFILYARHSSKRLIAADVSISILLFLWCFRELIASMYV
ncbi:MAG: hypothetical protein KGY60_03685 [Bacteroidales bacterium]|nr:hypothetical protein [Bacteroidales bacterium]